MHKVLLIHQLDSHNVIHADTDEAIEKCPWCQKKEPVVTVAISNGIVTKHFGYPQQTKTN